MIGVYLISILCGLLPSVRTAGLASLDLSSRLSSGDTLVSPSGRFELGIFALGGGSSADHSYQLAIRYAAPIQQAVTWIANHDIPLSSYAYVYVSPDGNLQLFDPDNNPNKPSWTSNAAANLGVVKALLQDSGNLVLVDQNRKVQWDSFVDSPCTDTLLPGQHLQKTANLNMSSWKASDNPATGLYSFGWGGVNMSVLQLTWTSPMQFMNWTGGAYIPAPDVHSPHTITGVSSVYFHATLGHLYVPSKPADTAILSGGDPVSANTLKRITIDTDGGLRIWQWNIRTSKSWTAVANWVIFERPESRSQCTVMGTCGPYGWCISEEGSVDRVQCRCPNGFKPKAEEDITRGCMPVVQLLGSNCNDTAAVTMEEMVGVDMPWGGDYKNLTGADSSRCKEECLKDCECAGAVYSAQEQNCWLKQGPLFNIGYPTVDLHGTDRTAYIKVSKFQPPTPDVKPSERVLPAIIGGSVGAGVCVLLILVIMIWCACKCRKEPPQTTNEPMNRPPPLHEPITIKRDG